MRTMTATELAESFFDQMDPFLADLDDGILVSQDRVVDRLLDLYNASTSTVVRREITDVLADIRHLRAVGAAELRVQAALLAACAAVEAAVEADVEADEA